MKRALFLLLVVVQSGIAQATSHGNIARAGVYQSPEPKQDFPLKRLTPFTYGVDYEPFWSPDGHQIVLISNRHGGPQGTCHECQ